MYVYMLLQVFPHRTQAAPSERCQYSTTAGCKKNTDVPPHEGVVNQQASQRVDDPELHLQQHPRTQLYCYFGRGASNKASALFFFLRQVTCTFMRTTVVVHIDETCHPPRHFVKKVPLSATVHPILFDGVTDGAAQPLLKMLLRDSLLNLRALCAMSCCYELRELSKCGGFLDQPALTARLRHRFPTPPYPVCRINYVLKTLKYLGSS